MKNLIQAAVVTLFAASAAQAQQAVQWKVSDGGNGHWYLLAVNGKRSWTDARTWAMSIGGHLATFQTQAEWNVIWQRFDGSNGYWIGLFQDPPTGLPPDQGWRWVTNEPLDFTAWGVEEPNDWIGYQQWVAQAGNAYWDDTIETGLQVPVVEWDADCNGDGIVDYGQCHDGTLPDYNSNNVPDCCERGEACVTGNYPVQWRIEDGGNGHWYAVLLEEPSISEWTEKSSPPSAPGFHLVIVNSDSENRFLINFIQTVPSAPARLWIGLYRISGTTWVWNIDQGSTFTFWGGANCGAGPYPNYGYSGFLAAQFNNRSTDCGWNWDDFAPEITPGCWQLLEYDTDCNHDGIVDYGQIITGQFTDANTDGIPDVCQQPTCRDADLFRDLNVNGADLGILLSQWGPNAQFTVSDINKDGSVNGADLGLLLSFWGACPN
jgi:hypothetical protein